MKNDRQLLELILDLLLRILSFDDNIMRIWAKTPHNIGAYAL